MSILTTKIIDDEYRIIKTKPIERDYIPIAYKTYWKDNEMSEEEIANTEFRKLDKLFSLDI